MTRSRPFFRSLGDGDSSATDASPDALPNTAAAGSDFVLILTAVLCALICLLGLITVARCACFRRRLLRPQSPNSSKANRGLKKKILRSLPKISFSPDSAANFSDCAICLAEFAAGDEIRVLPQCGHAFHVICVDLWLESHSSCPSCRQILAASATCEKR